MSCLAADLRRQQSVSVDGNVGKLGVLPLVSRVPRYLSTSPNTASNFKDCVSYLTTDPLPS
jgi:hypothetical protein